MIGITKVEEIALFIKKTGGETTRRKLHEEFIYRRRDNPDLTVFDPYGVDFALYVLVKYELLKVKRDTQRNELKYTFSDSIINTAWYRLLGTPEQISYTNKSRSAIIKSVLSKNPEKRQRNIEDRFVAWGLVKND